MATSSLLGIDADNLPPAHSATGIDSLGPSDASDSGSDSAGAYSAETDSDTDRFGTGERGGVEPGTEPSARDILPDQVESAPAATGPDDGMAGKPRGAPSADDLPGANDTEDSAEADENAANDAP